MVAFTQKGKELIDGLTNVTLILHPFEVVAEGQMRENVKRNELYATVMLMLRKGFSITGVPFKTVLFSQRVISFIKRKIKK